MECSRNMGHRYSPEYVATINELITAGLKACPERHWLSILESLQTNNHVRYENDVCPDELLIHVDNRGGLGCNAFDVHRNLVMILAGGANPEKLRDATSIERAPYGKHREEQIKFNQELDMNGYLAGVNGRERLCTLGCGHFGQAAKATRAGCRTPEPSLANTDGHLSLDQLSKSDHRYGELCKGYRHLVLPYDAQVAWPRLPMLIQKALNASNNVPTQQTEFETAVSMSEFLQAAKGRGDMPSTKQLVDAVEGSSACKGYDDKIATMVCRFAGGDGAPAIHRMSQFHKLLGGTGKLGEELMSSLVDTKSSDPTTEYPYAREALMTCACTSSKQQDGMFTMIKIADVKRMINPKNKNLQPGEHMCGIALELLNTAVEKGMLCHEDKTRMWGCLLTRWVLLSVGKQDKSFESRVFNDLREVKGTFSFDYGAKVKRDLDCFCGWDEHMDAGATVVPKAANAREIQVIDNELMADPVFQLQRHGFAKGEYVAEFNVKGGSIFKLKAIEKDAAKPFDDSLNACIIVLEEHALFREPFVAKVTFATFVRDFRPKGDFKPQVRVTTIQPSIIADKDHMKIAAYFALQHVSEETKSVGDMNGSLMYLVQPKELRAAKPFKKGELRLAPMTGLDKLRLFTHASNWSGPTMRITQDGGPTYEIGTPHMPAMMGMDALKPFDPDIHMCAPYWHVGSGDIPTMEKVILHSGGVEVDCLRNSKELKVHDIICTQRVQGPSIRVRSGVDPKAPEPKVARKDITPKPTVQPAASAKAKPAAPPMGGKDGFGKGKGKGRKGKGNCKGKA